MQEGRRPMLDLEEGQTIIGGYEEPSEITLYLEPPGDPILRGQEEGGCTFGLGEVGAPTQPIIEYPGATFGLEPSGNLTLGA